MFYQLEAYDDALRLAMEAKDRFDVNSDTQYVNTLVYRAIEVYTAKRVALMEKKEEGVVIDGRMEAIMNRKFEHCFTDGKFKQAMGIALETKRIDMVKAAIEKSPNPQQMLSYAFTLAQDTIESKEFRTEILNVIM